MEDPVPLGGVAGVGGVARLWRLDHQSRHDLADGVGTQADGGQLEQLGLRRNIRGRQEDLCVCVGGEALLVHKLMEASFSSWA